MVYRPIISQHAESIWLVESRMGTYCMIFGVLVLTLFWPDFSQQSLISSKDKSRDDLQQNLQISVNAISVLLSNENYTSNELNALLIGEGGLIQDWFKNSQDESQKNAWVELVSENPESVWTKYFFMEWKQVASEQIMLGTRFVTPGKVKIYTDFFAVKSGVRLPNAHLTRFPHRGVKKASHFTGKWYFNSSNSTRNIIGS